MDIGSAIFWALVDQEFSVVPNGDEVTILSPVQWDGSQLHFSAKAETFARSGRVNRTNLRLLVIGIMAETGFISPVPVEEIR